LDPMKTRVGVESDVPELSEIKIPDGEMPALLLRYEADHESLHRKYPLQMSGARRVRMERFYRDWLAALEGIDYEGLMQADRIDFHLFANRLNHELRQLDLYEQRLLEMEPLLPFAATVLALEEQRLRMEWAEPERAAVVLHDLTTRVMETRSKVEAALTDESGNPASPWKATVGNRAAEAVKSLLETLEHWFTFYQGYDPLFTWWAEQPYKALTEALQGYGEFLRTQVAGLKPDDKETIIGDPIGREALRIDLAYELIPYTPEELIAIAEQEWNWCEQEMRRAAANLGYGDDWHAALEHIKTLHRAPGGQPELIRELAVEAIEFLDQRDLLTIPPLARETWRMEMMSPEKQLVNPFFLGGEMIQVSFPTNTMTHEQKRMSMRGNNVHFARATVQHELIPGHHLQMFMMERYRPYRHVVGTVFWIEGWALYWEMLLWELGFPATPENRIGMLFWRMHRCVRIIFSLGFHLEQLTPQECVEMLVQRVGHERANAVAEVRRSFGGDYPPLYQAAYLLGGLQIRQLRRELVEASKMTDRAFHDAILKENSMPIEMLRAALTEQALPRDFATNWRFY
jgi:uncharacterized protein (DUF885 family)